MYRTSSVVAAGLAALRVASAQSSVAVAIPEITGGSSGGNAACGGCYVVADVAGIAFGSEINTVTATNQVIVVNGINSTYTTTSLVFEQGDFTFGSVPPAAQTGVPAQATPLGVETTTTVINGVTLTSPTAYNVFTAYSVTSYANTNGGCKIVAGPATTLNSAFSVAIPEGVDYDSFASQAEQSFIAFLGMPTCSGGGENLTPTSIIPQTTTTTSVTTTAKATYTPQPAVASQTARSSGSTAGPTSASSASASRGTSVSGVSTASAVTSAFSTFVPFALPSGTTSAYLANGTGTIFIPYSSGHSIVIAGADRVRQAGSWLAGAAALIMGFVA